MIFLLQEEITDGLEAFKTWFEADAIPQSKPPEEVALFAVLTLTTRTSST